MQSRPKIYVPLYENSAVEDFLNEKAIDRIYREKCPVEPSEKLSGEHWLALGFNKYTEKQVSRNNWERAHSSKFIFVPVSKTAYMDSQNRDYANAVIKYGIIILGVASALVAITPSLIFSSIDTENMGAYQVAIGLFAAILFLAYYLLDIRPEVKNKEASERSMIKSKAFPHPGVASLNTALFSYYLDKPKLKELLMRDAIKEVEIDA